MLVINRKIGERIRIADEIVVTVRAVKGDRVILGISAPSAIRVFRSELVVDPAECLTSGSDAAARIRRSQTP